MKKYFDHNEAESIGREYLEGNSIEWLCDKYGCSSTPIQTALKTLGIEKRKFGAGGKVKCELDILRLANQGMKAIDISKALGVHIGTVYNACHRSDIKSVFVKRSYTEDEKEKICRLYNEGMSTVEIADLFNTGMSMICKILGICGINRRNSVEAYKGKQYPCYIGDKVTVFRSSYEVHFANILEYYGIQWEYEKARFDLGYVTKRMWTYTPDFYLSEIDVHIDVKGFLREKQKKRLNLFYSMYPEINLVILYDKDLIKLGITLGRLRDGTSAIIGLGVSPLVERSAKANSVNSVEVQTGNAVDNTERSQKRIQFLERLTTISKESRCQEASKRGAPIIP